MTTLNLNQLRDIVHAACKEWWLDLETGTLLNRNRGEMLMLMVSEISEAMEGERKSTMDSHLPHRRTAEVELADLLIRLLDYCGGCGYDLEGAFQEKMLYNSTRKDHTAEARREINGKKW